jgi:hypothetical protein
VRLDRRLAVRLDRRLSRPQRLPRMPSRPAAGSAVVFEAAADQVLKGKVSHSYCHWGRPWEGFAAGRLVDARRDAVAAVRATAYFVPITLPLAARAALWAGDAADASAIVGRIEPSVNRGQAIALDVVTLRAGVAALEGRRTDAITGYREALRGWRSLGLAFDEALAALDIAILLAPTEREMAEAASIIEVARETLTRIGARPLLARLEAGPTITPGVAQVAPVGASGDRRVNV